MVRLVLTIISLLLLSAFAESAPSDKIYQIPDLAQTNKQIYSIEDLEVLSSQNAYEEFFIHARDIVPAKRKEKWNSLVANMAQGLARQIKTSGPVARNAFDLIEGLHTWPSLKGNEVFRADREKISLAYLTNCFAKAKSDTQCLKDTVKFWRASNPSPQLGFDVGNLVYKYLTKKNKAPFKISRTLEHQEILDKGLLEFYSPALEHGLSEFYCKEEQLQKLIWNELISFADRNKSNEKKVAHHIDKLMHPDCWAQLLPDYQRKLTSRDRIARDFSYLFLKSKKTLKQQDSDAYLFVYLMEIPSPGRTFNEAWGNLELLGKNHSRRIALLKRLKQLDPLPDTLFSSFDDKLKKVTTNHISQWFPEYLDFYANTCNDYVLGNKKFPNGNPTLNCRSFYKINKEQGFVAKFLEQQYLKATTL